MGNRYHADVHFPKTATKIPEIKQWLAAHYSYGIYEDDGIIQVSDPEANYGEIDITDLLDENAIPYDHYHYNFNTCKNWTVCVRFTNDGTRVETVESAFDIELSTWASDVLQLFDTGNLNEVRDALQKAANGEVLKLEEMT